MKSKYQYVTPVDLPDKPPIRMMPHFRLVTPDGHVSTWVPSVTDLLAEDWIVA